LDGVKRGRCLISRKDNNEEENTEKKANVTLPGTVEKIIPAIGATSQKRRRSKLRERMTFTAKSELKTK